MFMVRWFDKKPVTNPVNSHSADQSLESKRPNQARHPNSTGPGQIITPVNPPATESNDINMPGGVMNMMLGYVDNNMNTVSHGPLISTLFSAIKTRKLQDLRALIAAVANGKPDETKALLDKDPSLALEKLEKGEFVISLSGHRFNMHPYQVALAVDDTQMAALIKSYFVDQKEADRQYDEQCPKGWEIEEEKKWKPIFDQRDILLRAIRDSKEGDITSSGDPDYIATERKGSHVANELAEFYRLLDATLAEDITAGKRPFNPNLLLEPLQMYDNDELYKEYFGGRWDDPRALFFIQKVIGYEGIQRYMPVNYVQAHQDWLDETAAKLQRNEPQARGTCFQMYRADNWAAVEFYPLRARGTSGFNFAIFGAGRVGARGCRRGPGASKLMSIKNSRRTELTQRQQQDSRREKLTSCLVM